MRRLSLDLTGLPPTPQEIVAYEGRPRPTDADLPNLRYLGVGPLPSQIIKDVPATAELVKLAP